MKHDFSTTDFTQQGSAYCFGTLCLEVSACMFLFSDTCWVWGGCQWLPWKDGAVWCMWFLLGYWRHAVPCRRPPPWETAYWVCTYQGSHFWVAGKQVYAARFHLVCVCLYWCQYFCMHYAHTEPLAFSFCWLMHCKVTNTRLDPQVSPLFRQWREWFGACRLSMSSRLAFENWAEILCCMYVCITKGNSVLDIVVVCALVCMPLHSSWYNSPVGVHWSKDTLFIATPKWNMPTHPVRGILQCMYMLEWPHTQAIQPGYEDFTLEAHPLTRISISDSSFVHVPCNLREKLEKKGLLKLWNPGQRMHNY